MSTYLHYVQYMQFSRNNNSNTNNSSGTNSTSLNLTRIIFPNKQFESITTFGSVFAASQVYACFH